MDAIYTAGAPAPIGPYSQAVKVGPWLYVAGQIPLDPALGTIIHGGIKEQTKRVLENIGAILQAAGGNFHQVVKATIYVQDIQHFAQVNQEYHHFFQDPFPARAVVQVSALPAGALIEMDAVAYIPEEIQHPGK
jgi:2-iminobutanoate/2-iminopropanoate deaminase